MPGPVFLQAWLSPSALPRHRCRQPVGLAGRRCMHEPATTELICPLSQSFCKSVVATGEAPQWACGATMATVPACLLLSASLRLPARRGSNQQQHGRQHQRWRPAAVAAGARAPTTAVRERKKDGLPQEAIRAFDARLWAGDLEGCLAVLRRAAAAAADGPPRPLLGPERNRSLIQACFARRRPAAAIAYLQLLHPQVADWAAVLKEASKRRDVDTLRQVLAARAESGLGPDHRTTTAAIAGYAAGGRLPDALAVFCRARVMSLHSSTQAAVHSSMAYHARPLY